MLQRALSYDRSVRANAQPNNNRFPCCTKLIVLSGFARVHAVYGGVHFSRNNTKFGEKKEENGECRFETATAQQALPNLTQLCNKTVTLRSHFIMFSLRTTLDINARMVQVRACEQQTADLSV